MAEFLLLPLVRGVSNKAASTLVQGVSRVWGIDGNRRKLERQLLAVQCKLADAEVKSESDQYMYIKRWMKDLRTVTYEADDVLDDFQYEALHREAQVGDSRAQKVLSHFTNHSPLLFRFVMSRKLNNVLEKINNLVEEMNTFGLVENHAEAPPVLYRQTHSALDNSAEFFGREDDKEVVVKLLLDQQDQHQVQVLPIFGMGGLGKTTLAKMVYNDPRVQQHFHLSMWHCVSENFEATALMKSIIELVTKGTCNLPDTIELLRARIQEVVGYKRYLLVLDDVWNEEVRKWEDEVKPLLSYVGGPGSLIVVTCRSQQVASIMGSVGPHKLACLSEDDSWKLFSKKAFSNGVDEQAELVTVGRRIVKKCRGLPLALKTMGGLMSSKQQLCEWEAIEESNIGDSARGKDEILSILKLSYRHLSSELKQCFAFCALFPKDWEMEKDKMIQLWIANGFIQEEEKMDLPQKGEFVFQYLVWRSFLQDVKTKELHFRSYSYEMICCKMHDLMHDLATDVADECATVEELVQQKASLEDTRHVQIFTPGAAAQIDGLYKGTTYLRTLLEPCTPHKNLKELRLMSLRALQCSVPSLIHNNVLNAKHLRYLDLSCSAFVRLPDSLSMLYNLQTLNLIDCMKLQRLPDGLSAMRKLIHLYLFGCDSLERMPRKVGVLNNLRTLTTFVVDTGDGRGIDELKDMRHLANRLELYNLGKVKSGQIAKEANLHQKQDLRELSLYWSRKKNDKSAHAACNEEQLLDCLVPHSKLQILNVGGYGGVEVSQWMRDPQMFHCLRKLVISNCPRCKDLPVVWLSVSLEYLCLDSMGSLSTLGKSIEVEAGHDTQVQFFPKLKEMALYELQSLDKWMENSAGEPIDLVMFPVLEVLSISNCAKIASVPGSPVLKHLKILGRCSLPVSSLTHLTTLSELTYHGSGTVSISSLPLVSWPSLVKLDVWSLANTMMVPLEDQQSHRQRPMETLRNLRLYKPSCFITPSTLSRSYLLLWERFAFVEELFIFSSSELVLWPIDELRILARLRSLSIFSCRNLEGEGSSSEEPFPLPMLEKLDIRNCKSLLAIPKLPTTLEHLKIFDCESLVSLPLNLRDLSKLRDLHVSTCRLLKVLPDGMDCLTSLEQFWISYCPGMEKFTQGLLHRLPALGTLSIRECPELEKRCKEGGEYFHLVSSIPRKSISAETESTRGKKLLRRLLPFCGGS